MTGVALSEVINRRDESSFAVNGAMQFSMAIGAATVDHRY
jgi:hypothetical protein